MEATPREKLRNVAIIAHVDHGKTTLVDAMLRQTGVFRANEAVTDRVLDSGDLERERGITILAKHASVFWNDHKINIIDTPGHADFGGEVERTLRMADGAILLVDAAEGALPQTRFVLGKALELGLPVIVVINKIDRKDARPDEALNEVFDLFCDLGATDEQADFPTVYAIGKEGVAKLEMDATAENLEPLFQTIVDRVPAPSQDPEAPLQFLVHNILHDEYVGRLAIGRLWGGRVSKQQNVVLLGAEGSMGEHKIGTLWGFEELQRVRIDAAEAGDIVAISGIDDVTIGDTLADPKDPKALPRIEVDEPTIQVRFLVNTSPFAGLSGKYVTSRQVRDRLYKEAERNMALKVEDSDETDQFIVFGRGELMLSILAETMRREGYELAMGMPEVVTKVVDGVKCEPWEQVVVDVDEEHVGAVTQALGERRGQMVGMSNLGFGRARITYRVPSRGLIGFRSIFLTQTRGSGLINTLFDGWEPFAGPMLRRKNGAIVADRKGATTPYALFGLQPRGELFIGSGVEVYEGMIIGEHNRPNDLDVNATREKKLTNVRAAGKDENTILSTPKELTIESALEWIDQDELVEITPDAIRVRKRVLQTNIRPRRDGPKK
ncbi:MAG: translational GTPase TypA [Sandaracinus sp.]|nr:translational GTPase TypA [Sandaracinus sp.]|tara:strand:- start:3339 stop:5165 length:1827 start_codon:yes stop_codon:yes gene_type:complete